MSPCPPETRSPEGASRIGRARCAARRRDLAVTMSSMKSKRPGTGAQDPPQEVVDRLAELLPEGALDDAVRGLKPDELSGPGGLLSQLAGRVVEAALEAELTEHLGHPPGGVPQGANVRNGATAKTLKPIWGQWRSGR